MKSNMKINFLTVIIFCIFCSSCSPQNRIARIAEKYNLYSIDTLYYKDTIYIPQKTIQTVTLIDTTGHFAYLSGDIDYQGYIVKDSLIFLTITVPADTIYISKNIPTTKIEVKQDKSWKSTIWQWLFICAFCFIAVKYIISLKQSK